jgi:cell fate regulator YaaT (PSP1 superfamily)
VINVVSLQFHPAGKLYDFNAGTLELKPGDRVVVETERGIGLAFVVTGPQEKDETLFPQPLALIKRLIGPEDQATIEHHCRREKEAHDFCLRRIKERNMDMKLVRVEYLFDGSKAVFYFTADGRIDFRELVKDLAHTFHTRIEMRQIGVRDEAKMVGGLGICGRELCCCSFLRDFQPVSVKMAKEQNLALNPTKISGQCGRLLCCLDYEYEAYTELRKSFPKCGKRACTEHQCGTVEKVNLLTGEITMRGDDNKLLTVKASELVDDNNRPQKPAAPAQEKQEPRRERPNHQDQQKRSSHQKNDERKTQQQQPKAQPQAVVKVAEEPAKPSETADNNGAASPAKKKRNRNRRHGHRKNRDKQPESQPQE